MTRQTTDPTKTEIRTEASIRKALREGRAVEARITDADGSRTLCVIDVMPARRGSSMVRVSDGNWVSVGTWQYAGLRTMTWRTVVVYAAKKTR